MFSTPFVILVVFVLSFVYKKHKKPANNALPPGPTPLPFLGNAHQLYVNPCKQFNSWAKEYGPAVTIKLGSETWIILNSPQLLKQVFAHPSSAGRTDNPIFWQLMRGPHGIVFSDGNTWREQRQFAIKTLKNLGTTGTQMESLLLEEAEILVKWFGQQGNNRVKGNKVFFAPAVNSLWTIVCGKRCNWESDKSRAGVVDQFYELFHAIANCIRNGILFAPALIRIAPKLLGWHNFLRKASTLRNTLNHVIAEHISSFDETHLRDYIDEYLVEHKASVDKTSSFYKTNGENNLVASLVDLFGAGSESTSLVISWAVLYLSKNMHIQEKMYEEIIQTTGDRTPCIHHRQMMPFTEAVILETLRIRPVFYITLPHRMIDDKKFGNFMFKKNTVVIGNLFTMLHDEAVWKDPEVFNPERFLNEGKLNSKMLSFLPFSDGKRKCFGETIARNTIFTILTNIVKNFLILPDGESSTEPKVAGFLEPKDFEVILRPRNIVE